MEKYKPFAKNYIPRSISFAAVLLGPMGDVGYNMLVDKKKAKKIVESLIKEGKKVEQAILGLDGDWRINNTQIYDEDGFHEYDAYHLSCWATPTLLVNYTNSPSEAFECWKKERKSLIKDSTIRKARRTPKRSK